MPSTVPAEGSSQTRLVAVTLAGQAGRALGAAAYPPSTR